MGNHAAMVTLYFMHYNLARVHQTLRMRAMTRTWAEDWDARKLRRNAGKISATLNHLS